MYMYIPLFVYGSLGIIGLILGTRLVDSHIYEMSFTVPLMEECLKMSIQVLTPGLIHMLL